MNLSKKFVLASVSAILLTLSIPVRAQDVPAPTLPDYSTWTKVDSIRPASVIGDKAVNLLLDRYAYSEDPSVRRYNINILHDEKNNPWLAIYFDRTIGQGLDGGLVQKEVRLYLFENSGGAWVFVKDQSRDSQESINDFLKTKYNLVVGR